MPIKRFKSDYREHSNENDMNSNLDVDKEFRNPPNTLRIVHRNVCEKERSEKVTLYVTGCLYVRHAYMRTGICIPMSFKGRNHVQVQSKYKDQNLLNSALGFPVSSVLYAENEGWMQAQIREIVLYPFPV